MKFHTEVFVVGAMLLALIPGCQNPSGGAATAPGAPVDAASDAVESNIATLWVRGLACPFCVQNVEKQLLRVDGVEHVNVVLDIGKVTAVLSQSNPPSESSLRSAIKDSGFTLDRIEMP